MLPYTCDGIKDAFLKHPQKPSSPGSYIEWNYNTFATSILNKLTSVLYAVCPVIDREFHHHIVKVAVDPRGDSRVDPQTTLTR